MQKSLAAKVKANGIIDVNPMGFIQPKSTRGIHLLAAGEAKMNRLHLKRQICGIKEGKEGKYCKSVQLYTE